MSKHTRCLERMLEVALYLLSEDVYFDGLSVVEVFYAYESLNELGVGEVEIDVHDAHESWQYPYRPNRAVEGSNELGNGHELRRESE